ncbi:MAG: DUF222 domain-containing protein [Mycobacteriales bacterium]
MGRPKPRPAANRVKDTRGTAQRTGDALIELARMAMAEAKLPAHGGTRPNVLLTMSLTDLRGEHAPAGRAGPTAGAGELTAIPDYAMDQAARRVLAGPQPFRQFG